MRLLRGVISFAIKDLRRGGRGMGFRTSSAIAALLVGLAAPSSQALAQYYPPASAYPPAQPLPATRPLPPGKRRGSGPFGPAKDAAGRAAAAARLALWAPQSSHRGG